MPRYTFACPNGHGYEAWAGFDDIWAECPDHGVPGPRDFLCDLQSQSIDTGDQFRKYHLSTRKERAAQHQQRPIEGPTDNFERRSMEKMFGRTYIGDSTESLRPSAQKAIAREKVG